MRLKINMTGSGIVSRNFYPNFSPLMFRIVLNDTSCIYFSKVTVGKDCFFENGRSKAEL
jgi:hypothetical protein